MSDTNDKMVSVYPNQESEIWLRSKNGIIAGVCQGVADRLVVHPWLIRGLWLASVLFFGAGLVLYFILAIGLSREDKIQEGQSKKVLGVCLRISKNAGVDVGMVRVLTMISACMSFGLVILAYVVLHFLLPWPSSDRTVTRAELQTHPTR